MSRDLRYFEDLCVLLDPDMTFLEYTTKLKKKAFKAFSHHFFEYLPPARLSRSQVFDFKLLQCPLLAPSTKNTVVAYETTDNRKFSPSDYFGIITSCCSTRFARITQD